MMNCSGPHGELDLLACAGEQVADVAPLEPVQQEQLVVAVDRVGAQPSVEAVEGKDYACSWRTILGHLVVRFVGLLFELAIFDGVR
jgi:hypothetical protein